MTDATSRLRRRHLLLGWTALAVFALLGAVLESLHALKLGFYLDVGNETRRLVLRLGHAHGALLGLVNVAFALSLPHLGEDGPGRRRLASVGLCWASGLLPLGFLLGAVGAEGGDPGAGIALVPAGALALVVALAGIVRGIERPGSR